MKIKISLLLLLLLAPTCLVNNSKEILEVDTIKYATSNQKPYLNNVTIDDVDFIFYKNKFLYEIEVSNSKSTLGLHYEASSKDDIVNVIGSENLEIGKNSISIIVTSKEGLITEYDFIIRRNHETTDVLNESNSIKDAIINSKSSAITIFTQDEGIELSSDITKILKNKNKNLIYKWSDNDGNFVASLTLKGSDINNTDVISPNIKNILTDIKLKNFVEGYEYTPFTTKNTNIPKGSIYKYAVHGNDETYYLYLNENGIITNKPLRNIEGIIEFEIENNKDYVLMTSKNRPTKKNYINWNLLRPALIISGIIVILFLGIRHSLINNIKKSNKNIES